MYSPMKVDRRFGGALLATGFRMVCCSSHSSTLKMTTCTFLGSVGSLSPAYTALYSYVADDANKGSLAQGTPAQHVRGVGRGRTVFLRPNCLILLAGQECWELIASMLQQFPIP
jgi:hypothetical protein